MAKKFYDPQECVGFMTYTTSRLLVSALHKQMEEMGLELTSEQWGMLVQLFNRGQILQEEITRASGVDKSTTSRTLGLMECRGLIVRNTDPADTRRKILNLTQKAQAIKEDSLQAVQSALAQALQGVDSEERRICLKVLKQIKENLQKSISKKDE